MASRRIARTQPLLSTALRWLDRLSPPGYVHAHDAGVDPVFVQSAFRGRNDDHSESLATWKAAQNTNWSQETDANFRVRFEVEETATATQNNTPSFQLQYNLNSAGWNNVTASSSVVRSAPSPHVAEAAATTNQLTTSARTFQAGVFEETDGLTAAQAAMSNEQTEIEYCVQIRQADVTDGDTIQLRLTNAGVVLSTYSQTPSITVVKIAAASAQPTYDADTDGSSSGSTTLTYSHTVANQSNRALYVSTYTRDGPVTGVTYAGAAMTKIVEVTSGNIHLAIWQKLAPATGANNVVVTKGNTSGGISAQAISYYDVNQVNPIRSFAWRDFGFTNTFSLTTSSDANDVCFEAMGTPSGGADTMSPDAGQTLRSNRFSAGDLRHGTSTEGGASTVTMGWSGDNGDVKLQAIISIRAAPAPVVVTAAAVLSAAGSIAELARATMRPTAALNAAGTIAAAAGMTTRAAATLNGVGSTVANGFGSALGAASLTATGQVVADIVSLLGTGVSFPYADRYINYGAILTPVASNFSAAVVLDMTAFGELSGGQGHRALMRISETDENPCNFSFGVGPFGTGGDTRLSLAYNSGGVWYDHLSTAEVSVVGRRMVGFTTDGTTIYFYIDGALVSSIARSGPGFPTTGTFDAVGIGKPGVASSGNHSPRATVEYVAYWDRLLTDADMAQLGDGSKSPLFLPANLKFYADLVTNTAAGCMERITRTVPTFTTAAPDSAYGLGTQDPITHIATVESSSTSEATNHIVNLPQGQHPGDRIVIGIAACDGTASGTYQALSGWTLRQEGAMSGLNRFAVYERVVPSGGLGASVTIVNSQACGFVAFASMYRPKSGYDAELNIFGTVGTGTGTTATAPSETSTKALGMRIHIAAFDDDDAVEGSFFPAGVDGRAYIEQATPGDGITLGVADDIQPEAGATGTVVFSNNGLSEEWNAISLVIVASRTVTVAAVLAGTGAIAALAGYRLNGEAALTGVGTVVADATVIVPFITGEAALTAVGSILAAARLTANGESALTGAGSLAALAQARRLAESSVLGSGTIAAVARAIKNSDAALTGTGQVVAAAFAPGNSEAVLTATGSIAALARMYARTASALQGEGTLVSDASALRTVAAALTATGSVNANGVELFTAAAILNGQGLINGQGVLLQRGAAVLNIVGSMLAASIAQYRASAVVNALGSIQALARYSVTAQSSVLGGVAFLGNARAQRTAAAALTGFGLLQAVAVELSTALDPAIITGRMYFEVLSGGVIVGSGPIHRVFESGVQHKLDSAGRWAFTLDIADEYYPLLQHGREIHIFREGEGCIAKGIIGLKEIAPA